MRFPVVRGTNARRMERPISVRMGMFWRFGSLLESLPVAVTVWLRDVWSLPVFGLIISGRASIYVDLSFESVRNFRISAGKGWTGASSSSTSTLVENPVLVFLVGVS